MIWSTTRYSVTIRRFLPAGFNIRIARAFSAVLPMIESQGNFPFEGLSRIFHLSMIRNVNSFGCAIGHDFFASFIAPEGKRAKRFGGAGARAGKLSEEGGYVGGGVGCR